VSRRGTGGDDGVERPDRLPEPRSLAARLRSHLAAVVRIARWEVSRGTASVDRRTAAVGLVALLLAGGVGAGVTAAGGVALEEDLYRVGVAADSPYATVVEEAPSLVRREPGRAALDDGRLDLLVGRGEVVVPDTRKGEAALGAFRAAVEAHNGRLMAAEENRSAAFPVVVSLRYANRDAPVSGPAAPGGGGDGGGGGGGTGGDGSTGGGLAVPGLGGGGGALATGGTGSPADISPPFPFSSLVLAFAFLVPMNFVVQAYGSTMLNERINRRGELLLVAPVSPGDIVAGKTLPYLGATLLVTAAIAFGVGGSLVSVAAVVPVALAFLSATFVGAMFARSFKELTFVTVAVSVFLTTYTFVPAIFTDVTPIALISPLTVVVRDLETAAVTPAMFAFATGPFTLCSLLLFALGSGVYREEDLFTQRPVPLKFLDALDARLGGPSSVAVLSGLAIPFVFVAELLAVAVLYALPVAVSVPVILVVVALVEELAKSLHVYAGFENGRFPTTAAGAGLVGVLSGAGFFVGEKATAVVQLVGLPDLVVGRAAFATTGVGVAEAAVLLVAPLALHGVTAGVTALGARRDLTGYGVALAAAVAIHTAYNLAVVDQVVGSLG
jgi:ABC-type Na+ efflux pump permease subunit